MAEPPPPYCLVDHAAKRTDRNRENPNQRRSRQRREQALNELQELMGYGSGAAPGGRRRGEP